MDAEEEMVEETQPTGRIRRNRRIEARKMLLLDAGTTVVPKNERRTEVENTPGRLASIMLKNSHTCNEVLRLVHEAFERVGTVLRVGAWEFMKIVGRNALATLSTRATGKKLLDACRSEGTIYIRMKMNVPSVRVPRVSRSVRVPQRRRTEEQGPAEMDVDDDVIVVEDVQRTGETVTPPTPVQPNLISIEEAIFEQAVVGAGHVVVKNVQDMTDMMEGLTGPHVSSLVFGGHSKERPSALPVSPAVAEDIARRENRLLVVAVSLIPGREDTRLARFTQTEAFFHLIEARGSIFIHTLQISDDGKEFMRRCGVETKLPALVFKTPGGHQVVVTTAENGEMQLRERRQHVTVTEEDLLVAVTTLQDRDSEDGSQRRGLNRRAPDDTPDIGPPRPAMDTRDMRAPRPAMDTLDVDMRAPRPAMDTRDMRAPRPAMDTRDMRAPRPAMDTQDMRAPRPAMDTLDVDMRAPRPAMDTRDMRAPRPAMDTRDMRAPQPAMDTRDMRAPRPAMDTRDMRAPRPAMDTQDMRAPRPAMDTQDMRAPQPAMDTRDMRAPRPAMDTRDMRAPRPAMDTRDMRAPQPAMDTRDMRAPRPAMDTRDMRAPRPAMDTRDMRAPRPAMDTRDMRAPRPAMDTRDMRAPQPAMDTRDMRAPRPAMDTRDMRAPRPAMDTRDMRAPRPWMSPRVEPYRMPTAHYRYPRYSY
ncbi:uncharacterized protein LOC144917429 [Branchiostoma floridae x Branchiostoma belcheri]